MSRSQVLRCCTGAHKSEKKNICCAFFRRRRKLLFYFSIFATVNFCFFRFFRSGKQTKKTCFAVAILVFDLFLQESPQTAQIEAYFGAYIHAFIAIFLRAAHHRPPPYLIPWSTHEIWKFSIFDPVNRGEDQCFWRRFRSGSQTLMNTNWRVPVTAIHNTLRTTYP